MFPYYYTPFVSTSPDGLFNLPFVVGAFQLKPNKVVLLKGFTDDVDHNPLVLAVEKVRSGSNGSYQLDVVLDPDDGGELRSTITLNPLTPEYVLKNRSYYPFSDAQILSIMTPGNLSLYAQATIPEWYENAYPPPDDDDV